MQPVCGASGGSKCLEKNRGRSGEGKGDSTGEDAIPSFRSVGDPVTGPVPFQVF